MALAFLVSLFATVTAWVGALRGDERWTARGRRGAVAVAALLALAVVLLVTALISDRFALGYVAGHSAQATPLIFKVSALWAGQEGSLLLWAALQALVAALFVLWPTDNDEAVLVPWTVALLGVVTTFSVAISALVANPFTMLSDPPLDGVGLNPLLRHPAMVLHPPTLYLGYVGLAVPAALALAALIVKRPEVFPRAARPWALGSWLFLWAGLLLGARWAYEVLGWGGYWAWDAVENAGLMPWLTATGLVHALGAADDRRLQPHAYHAWGIAMAVASFLLVILGMFITRSGVIASVHAFAQSEVGPVLAVYLLLASAGSVGLIVARRQLLTTPQAEGRVVSWRETCFTLTLVLLSTLTASVLVGTLLPIITASLRGGPLVAGPEWFQRVTGPQLAALALLMGVCPLVGRLATGRPPEGAPSTRPAWRSGKHRTVGGYLVHVGVLVIALGVVGTGHQAHHAPLVLSRGESAIVLDYELTFEDLWQSRGVDEETTWATVAVYRGGTLRARLYPRLTHDPKWQRVVATPAVWATLREDLYLVLAGWTEGGGEAATFHVAVNPLVSLIWAGGLILLLGGAIALCPGRSGAPRGSKLE